jgi:hypothetical protein
VGVCRAKSKKERAGAEREHLMFDCLRAIESRSREDWFHLLIDLSIISYSMKKWYFLPSLTEVGLTF